MRALALIDIRTASGGTYAKGSTYDLADDKAKAFAVRGLVRLLETPVAPVAPVPPVPPKAADKADKADKQEQQVETPQTPVKKRTRKTAK